MEIFKPPQFIPEWLNDALFMGCLSIAVVSVCILITLKCIRNRMPPQGFVILGLELSDWPARIFNYRYKIFIVITAVAFISGALLSLIFSSRSDVLAEHTPISATKFDDEVVSEQTLDQQAIVKTPVSPATRVFTPRTPMELMDIAATKTARDAAKHKGTWIHVEGTVQNISEIRNFRPTLEKPYIKVEVKVGGLPSSSSHRTVYLYFDAEIWKLQLDKIERSDSLVANGTVEHVGEGFMFVRNAEIISVSGPERNRR